MTRGVVSEDPSFPFDLVRTGTKIRPETFLCKRVSRERLESWLVRMHQAANNKNRALNFSHLKLKHLRWVFSRHFLVKLFENGREVLLFLKNAQFAGRDRNRN